MAKLLRRVYRLPYCGLIAASAVGAWLVAGTAHAQRPPIVSPARPIVPIAVPPPSASAPVSVPAAAPQPIAAAPRVPAPQPAPSAAARAPAVAASRPGPRAAPVPTATDSASDIEATLVRLRSETLATRRAAVAQLETLDATDLPSLRQRLLAPLPIPSAAVHSAMVRAIRAVTGGRDNADYNLLDALVQTTPRTQDVTVATERIALARAVGRIPSADAGRIVLPLALEFDHVFRMEATRIIRETTRDYVVPALIELRHPTDDARVFIRQVRELLHRNTPGETVQMADNGGQRHDARDNALLGEILRAYGSIRQPDAMSVVVSFVNSDRTEVRDAARWAVEQYGREAINALRTAYENYVGEDANPQWAWDRTARELYQANDHRRGEEVSMAMDEGLAAARRHDSATMMARFEFVLAHHPLYERRGEMVVPLVAYARSLEGSDVAHAETVYRMALRVDPNGATWRPIQSAILFLQAEQALAHGVADPQLYEASLRAVAHNQRAQVQFDAVAQLDVLRARSRRRATMALGILAVALAGVGIAASRAKTRRVATA